MTTVTEHETSDWAIPDGTQFYFLRKNTRDAIPEVCEQVLVHRLSTATDAARNYRGLKIMDLTVESRKRGYNIDHRGDWYHTCRALWAEIRKTHQNASVAVELYADLIVAVLLTCPRSDFNLY